MGTSEVSKLKVGNEMAAGTIVLLLCAATVSVPDIESMSVLCSESGNGGRRERWDRAGRALNRASPRGGPPLISPTLFGFSRISRLRLSLGSTGLLE